MSSNVTSGTCVYISISRSIKVNKSGIVCRVYHQTSLQALVFTLVHQSQQVRRSVQGIPSNVTLGTCVYISTSRSIKVNKSGIVCRVYHQTSLQALLFTLVHQGPSKSTSQAQCAGYVIKRHFRHLCLHQYIKVHQSQQVRHSVNGIPSNVTSGTSVYISTSRSIKVNKSGIVCRLYHQTSLQALVFTLVHQSPSKSTSQAQCAGYTKRHFRHLCLHQYIEVHQSQQVRHSVQGIPSNVTSGTCVYISTSKSIKVNKSGIVERVYHQTSLQALVFTLVHQGPSKSKSQAQCAGYTIKCHFRHLYLHQYIKVHQSQQVRHSVQGIPSNVTSGTSVYISTSRSIKVNKSGIVCRVYHETSLQALVFTLVHQGPSKSTSQAQCAGYTIKRHFKHLCLHQYIKVHKSQQVRYSVQGIPSNVTSDTCVYISTSRSIKVNKSGIVCRVYHQTSLQVLVFTLVHQGPSKSTSQAQCAGYTIKRHFRHLCLHQYIKVHQSQQVRHSVQGIPSNVTSGTCIYISTSRSIKVNKSGIVCRVYHQTSLQALVFTLVHRGPSKSTSQAQCAGYTMKRHFRHLCLHQYIKVHQSQQVRHSVQGIPSNVISCTCVYISTSRSIKVNKSGIVCRVYHQTSLQALVFTLVHQGPSKSTSQAQCAGYTIKRHFRHLCLHQYIKVHQSQQVRHSVQGIPSNVTSGTCVYISTSKSIKVNKSGIVCRVYHQTSLQALVFTLVHQGPSKSTSQAQSAGYTKRHFRHLCLHQYIKVHQSQQVRHSVQGIPSNVTSGTCVYINTSRSIKVNKSGIVCRVYHQTSLQALVFTLVHQSPSKSTSQAQCAGYTIKRHFRHLCLHQYIKVHQSQQVRHSLQGIPSNVTSGTCVYISTSRSIKVKKSGIVCRVYHQMSLQALVFTLVHQGPSKSTSQAQCAGYTIKRHFRHFCLHQYIEVHQSQQVRHSVQGIPSNVTSGTCVYISTSRSIKVNKSGIVCRIYHQTSLQALLFTLVHQGPSKSTSQAQCTGYTIKRHFRHLCLHQYIKVHQSQQVRHSVNGIPSNVTSGTSVYISTSRSIKVNKSGIVCRLYHQTSLQALVFTLVHQGPSKSTSQEQCAGYTIKRHFRHFCLHQYFKVHQSQLVRHSVQGMPSNVTSGTCVYISTSRSIKVNKSGIVCRVYHQTSLQALVFTLVVQGPSKSTSQAQCAGYTIKRHFRHFCFHQYIKFHQSQQVRHSVQGIPSNVTSGTSVYISTSRSIKVNKSGIV